MIVPKCAGKHPTALSLAQMNLSTTIRNISNNFSVVILCHYDNVACNDEEMALRCHYNEVQMKAAERSNNTCSRLSSLSSLDPFVFC